LNPKKSKSVRCLPFTAISDDHAIIITVDTFIEIHHYPDEKRLVADEPRQLSVNLFIARVKKKF